MDVAQLLDELCREVGFCLDDESRAALIQAPPSDIDEFTDAVIRAEGMEPHLIEPSIRGRVRSRVARARQA